MKVSLIAAVAQNGIIGVQNRLPWSLPEDLRRFKQTTMGHPIVMGRKTLESLGRPLPGRENWVLTRRPDYRVEGVRSAHSLREVIEATESRASELFVIGGSEIYSLALPVMDRFYLTVVLKDFEGDACFPQWAQLWSEWRGLVLGLPRALDDGGSLARSRKWRVTASEGGLEPIPHRYAMIERVTS